MDKRASDVISLSRGALAYLSQEVDSLAAIVALRIESSIDAIDASGTQRSRAMSRGDLRRRILKELELQVMARFDGKVPAKVTEGERLQRPSSELADLDEWILTVSYKTQEAFALPFLTLRLISEVLFATANTPALPPERRSAWARKRLLPLEERGWVSYLDPHPEWPSGGSPPRRLWITPVGENVALSQGNALKDLAENAVTSVHLTEGVLNEVEKIKRTVRGDER